MVAKKCLLVVAGLIILSISGTALSQPGLGPPGTMRPPPYVPPPSYFHYPTYVPPVSPHFGGPHYLPPPSYFLPPPSPPNPVPFSPPVVPPSSAPRPVDPDGIILSPLLRLQQRNEPAPGPATLVIRVPAEADLWVDKFHSQQTGEVRYFDTPELPAGRVFLYEVRVRWKENGQEKEQTRQVKVWAGARRKVDFTGG